MEPFERRTYLDEFMAMKCAGDVLNAVAPINNGAKEISESMGIIKRIKPIVLKEPMKYRILDLCAGNALTSVLAVHLLPVKEAVAVDIRPRDRPGFRSVKRFGYISANIWIKAFDIRLINTIIISSHPCKHARRIVEIFNNARADALIMIPCCEGPLNNKYPYVFNAKMGRYLTWCYDLARECHGNMIVDKKILSPKNCIIVAEKNANQNP